MYNATIPLTALGTEALLAPTAANFPALKMFFKSEDWTIGDSTIADSISDLVIDVSVNVAAGSTSFNKDLEAAAGAGYSLPFSSGTFPIIGTKSFLLWVIGDLHATQNIVFGENYPNDPNGFKMSGGVGACWVDDGTAASVALDDLALSGDCIRGIGINAGTPLTGFSFEYDGSTLTYQSVATSLTGINTMASIVTGMRINSGHLGFNNMGLVEFAGALPPENFNKAMIAWQYEQAMLGNNVIYPGLKNVT